MLAVKGGRRNPAAAKKVAARKVSQRTTDRPRKVQPEDVEELPSRIAVKRSDWIAHLPGSIWQQAPFKWEPQPFALESERLTEKIVDPEVQESSLRRFIKDPTLPVVYGVCGNPSEEKARYFAAYLVDLHCRKLGSRANPIWHALYGGYDNKLLKDYSMVDPITEPSILVLCNLAPNSTNTKFEKAKDLIERFPTIPRIIVASGEDPISFLSTRLYSPCNAIAYFSESVIKKKLEII